MYYIVDRDSWKILETHEGPMTEHWIQTYADLFNCAVYAIQGENSGYSAEPQSNDDEEDSDE